MKRIANFRIAVIGCLIFVTICLSFIAPVNSSASVSAAPFAASSLCAADARCAKQKAILRRLERTKPSRKMTRQQIFRQIKAACDRMRELDCPGIRNYKPNICFTDF